MTEIKSPIGNMRLGGQQMPVYRVEDPTAAFSDRAINIPTASDQPVRITPEQYNRFRESADSMKAVSTQDVIDERGQEQRPLSTEDEEILGMLKQDPRAIQHARKKEQEKKNKITIKNKDRLEILLGLGRKHADVEVDGHSIVLQNLTSNQTRKVLNASAQAIKDAIETKQESFNQVYVTKHLVVAFALKSIDGTDVSELFDGEDTDENREYVVSEMDTMVVDKLYDAYVELIGKHLSMSAKEIAGETKK